MNEFFNLLQFFFSLFSANWDQFKFNSPTLQRKTTPKKNQYRGSVVKNVKLPKNLTHQLTISSTSGTTVTSTGSNTSSKDFSSTLDYLPYSIRQNKYTRRCIGVLDYVDQQEISECAVEGNIPKFKEIVEKVGLKLEKWKNWRYEIEVTLTMADFDLNLESGDDQILTPETVEYALSMDFSNFPDGKTASAKRKR